MTANIDHGFQNEEYLHSIREDFLNPLAKRVSDLKNSADAALPLAKNAFTGVESDIGDKTLTFHSDNGELVLSLDGMFDESKEVKVGGTSVEDIVFTDGTASYQNKKATVAYDWGKIVKDNQTQLSVGKGAVTSIPKTLLFKGDNITVTNEAGGSTTVEVTDIPQLKAQILTGEESTVQKIKIVGTTGGTAIKDDVLTIDLPAGGSSSAEGYFRGFFESLGDVISQVSNPVNGKSLVFVKDQTSPGDKNYNSYFYVNGQWTEVPLDPAVTYSPPTASETQGVFSIKPNPKITIDSKGQLNLDKLETPEHKLVFHGFYENQAALEADVPYPVLNKSYAFIKHVSGSWIGRGYVSGTSGEAWGSILPMGSLSLLNNDQATDVIAPIFGIAKNDDWTISSSGLLSLKSKPAELTVETSGYDNVVTSAKATAVKFNRGKSLATVSEGKITVEHPQRIINYNSTYESNHNSQDYEGNIFYDETSRCWMGWGIPEASGGVDVKWTRIAHPKMSDEVRDLSKRLPAKAPSVTPGILGDAPKWEYTSWTYVKQDDPTLPDALKNRCGGYFITIIREVEDDTPRPKERFQICFADEEGGHSYVRKWRYTDTVSDYGWSPWVKMSLSAKDISDHNSDPYAHTDHHRFYKVATVDMSWAELKAKNYKIQDKDLLLIADSFGLSGENEDTISIPYNGKFRFAGRLEFDGWEAAGSVYPTPQFIVYVYKVTPSEETIITEYAYNHKDHSKPVPPLIWKSDEITLSYGDKIRFELREFNSTASNHPNLALITSRSYFVLEDIRTVAGSRIAETHRRTVGTVNSKRDSGVNVHKTSPGGSTVRVYGVGLSTAVSMIKAGK